MRAPLRKGKISLISDYLIIILVYILRFLVFRLSKLLAMFINSTLFTTEQRKRAWEDRDTVEGSVIKRMESKKRGMKG